jgi:hypothetical protein
MTDFMQPQGLDDGVLVGVGVESRSYDGLPIQQCLHTNEMVKINIPRGKV